MWELAEAEPEAVGAPEGVGDARRWIDLARLATLRGIGAPNARALEGVGVASVADLAAEEPELLASRLRATGAPVEPARIRGWVRGARDAARPAQVSRPTS